MSSLVARAVALSFAAALSAQQVVVPAPFAIAEGGSTGNVWRAGANRVQCVYDSSNFVVQDVGQPILIQSVKFRLAGGLQANLVVYSNVEIHLQTAAVDHLALSSTFANNRSAPLGTPNYQGSISTVSVAGSTPNGYFLTIPLAIPFSYSPEAGQDLLMEIVIPSAPTPSLANTTASAFNVATDLCNSVRSVGSSTALVGTVSPFCPLARFDYTNAAGAATKGVYGTGCYDRPVSLYEQFAGSSIDLANKTITLTRNGNGGYTATTTPGSTIVPLVGTGLALGDDVVSAVIPLPFTFQFPGGATTAIVVDSNGSIGVAGAVASSIGGSGAALLALPSTRFAPAMQDLVPDGVTNVNNVFHYADPGNPNVYLITWNAVPCFGAQVQSGSTFQIALVDNGTNDSVEFRYGAVFNNSSSNAGTAVVGFSRGNHAVDPGSVDLTAGPVSSRTETSRVLLAANNRPVLGTNHSFTTSAIPATGVFSVFVLSAGQIPAGLDLGFVGAPGCRAYVALPEILSSFQLGAPTASSSIAIPIDPYFSGVSVYAQSVVFDPTANPAGLLVTNGVVSKIGGL